MRVLHPDLLAIWPGLSNPHESSYALAALTLLPNGLVGMMLAAMFSATMSSLSGVLNLHASIISRDIFPTLFPRRQGTRQNAARRLDRDVRGRRRDHGDRAGDGRGRRERLRLHGHVQHGDVARVRPAGPARPRRPAHAELVGAGGVRGRARGRLRRQLRPRLGPGDERAHRGAGVGGGLLPERASSRSARAERRAASDALFARLDTPVDVAAEVDLPPRPDGGGVPFPQPRHRRGGPALRPVRVHGSRRRRGRRWRAT